MLLISLVFMTLLENLVKLFTRAEANSDCLKVAKSQKDSLSFWLLEPLRLVRWGYLPKRLYTLSNAFADYYDRD